jgi:hypothetical protein
MAAFRMLDAVAGTTADCGKPDIGSDCVRMRRGSVIDSTCCATAGIAIDIAMEHAIKHTAIRRLGLRSFAFVFVDCMVAISRLGELP